MVSLIVCRYEEAANIENEDCVSFLIQPGLEFWRTWNKLKHPWSTVFPPLLHDWCCTWIHLCLFIFYYFQTFWVWILVLLLHFWVNYFDLKSFAHWWIENLCLLCTKGTLMMVLVCLFHIYTEAAGFCLRWWSDRWWQNASLGIVINLASSTPPHSHFSVDVGE